MNRHVHRLVWIHCCDYTAGLYFVGLLCYCITHHCARLESRSGLCCCVLVVAFCLGQCPDRMELRDGWCDVRCWLLCVLIRGPCLTEKNQCTAWRPRCSKGAGIPRSVRYASCCLLDSFSSSRGVTLGNGAGLMDIAHDNPRNFSWGGWLASVKHGRCCARSPCRAANCCARGPS